MLTLDCFGVGQVDQQTVDRFHREVAFGAVDGSSRVQLLLAHSILHWLHAQEEPRVRGDRKSLEDIVNAHVQVEEQGGRLGMQHVDCDELDDLARDLEPGLSPVERSGETQGEQIDLASVLPAFAAALSETVEVLPVFATVEGDVIHHRGDDLPESFSRTWQWRILRALPLDARERFSFQAHPWGERLPGSPLLAMVLTPLQEPSVIQMEEAEPEQMLRSALGRGFRFRMPVLWLVGGLVTRGRTTNDIDLLVRLEEETPEPLWNALVHAVESRLPPEVAGRTQWHRDRFHGPFCLSGDRVVGIESDGMLRFATLEHWWEHFASLSETPPTQGPDGSDLAYVPSGTRTLAWKDGEAVWSDLRWVVRKSHAGEMVLLRQRWGQTEVTPNHSVLNRKGACCDPMEVRDLLALRSLPGLPEIESVRLPEVHEPSGKRWELRRRLNRVYDWEDLPALLSIIAAFVSDGSVHSSGGRLRLTIADGDYERLEEVQNAFLSLWGFAPCLVDRRTAADHTSKIVIARRGFAEMFEALCGRRSIERRLPDWCFNLPRNLRSLLLEELVKGDGSIRMRRGKVERRFYSASPVLVAQISALLASLDQDFAIEPNATSPWTKHRGFCIAERGGSDGRSRIRREIRQADEFVYDLSCADVHNFVDGCGLVVVHNTSHVPLASLDFAVVEPAQEERLTEQVPERTKRKGEARDSMREDRVRLGRFFLMPKPTKPAEPKQPSTLDGFLALFGEEAFPVYSSMKFDGARHQAHLSPGSVVVISEDGTDNSDAFPLLRAELRRWADSNRIRSAVLDAEITSHEDGEPQPREVTAAHINRKPPVPDEKQVANVFDILLLNGTDLHRQPFAKRWETLSGFRWRQASERASPKRAHLNLVPHLPARTPAALRKETERLAAVKGSEGNVAKKAESIYPLDGKTDDGWVKHRNALVVRARVKARKETATPGVWTYTYAVGPMEMGETFATDEERKVGDPVLVEVENVNETRDEQGKLLALTGWAPRVVTSGREASDTVESVLGRARRAKILRRKVGERIELREDTLPVLKLEDPARVLALLAAGEPAGFASRLERRERIGEPQLLVNERKGPDGDEAEAIRAWGIVRQREPEGPFHDLVALGSARLDAMPTVALREFRDVKHLWWIPLEMVERFEPPRELPGAVPGRRFGPEVEVQEERLTEAAQPFGVYGGSSRYAERLVKRFPPHRVYVEPFCGGGACFFRKEPSDVEVLNDKDAELAHALRFIRDMSDADLAWLKSQDWRMSKDRWKRLGNERPSDPRRRFFRFITGIRCSFSMRHDFPNRGFSQSSADGLASYNPESLLKHRDRLKGAKITTGDWKEAVRKHDAKDALFFLDPPYPEEWHTPGDAITAEQLAEVLNGIKGRFICVLQDNAEHQRVFARLGRVFRMKVRESAHPGQDGKRRAFRIFCTNIPARLKEENARLEVVYCADCDNELMPHGVFCPRLVEELREQDPYLTSPAEKDQPVRYVVQHHWRGKGVHSDLRFGSSDPEFAIGWTLTDQVAGSAKEPVLSLADARKALADPKRWKIDWGTGEFRERETAGGDVRRASIQSQKKAVNPRAWLEVQGVVGPGGVGATQQFPGVFLRVDDGKLWYGWQQPDSHEYFLDGKRLRGKLLVRALTEEAFAREQVLPPSEEQEISTPGVTWLTIQPTDQTPFVLSTRAVEEEKIPEQGTSTLPPNVRDGIPPALRYWEQAGRAERLKVREQLVQLMRGEPRRLVSETIHTKLDPEELRAALDANLAKFEEGLRFFDSRCKTVAEFLEQESFSPPAEVAHAAEKGLRLRREFGRGGTEIGVARARDLSNRRSVSLDTIRRMFQYFERHEVDSQAKGWEDESDPSPGWVAWLLWGGDPGRAWATRIWQQHRESLSEQRRTRFVLQAQTWKGPSPIRLGPSSEVWRLWLPDVEADGKAWHFLLTHDPTRVDALIAIADPSPSEWSERGEAGPEEVEPGGEGRGLNPTQETPSTVEWLDAGDAVLLEDGHEVKRVRFDGERMRGLWLLTREEGASDQWEARRIEESPSAEETRHDVLTRAEP